MGEPAFEPLRSSRLVLRRLCSLDAAAMCGYRNLPEVARFQSWDRFGTQDAGRLIADQAGRQPDVPGTWFQLGIALKSSGELVGDCGLHFDADDPRQMEVGITLSPRHQRQGIAAETIGCVLDYVFVTLGKHRVTAITDADNTPAARLFERAGFRREGHFIENIVFKGGYGSEYLFAILRREWLAAKVAS